ncbi:MAG: hypothetical protein V3V28_12495 [Polaribacter sp.]|uniref:hypothetical protein n=1 Tax=Polaribacter sp. TaxID=1920175 RepID=UPI002F35A3F8
MIKVIDGFKIILFNMHTYGILKRYNGNLILYQLKKDSIIKMSINEITVSNVFRNEMQKVIKSQIKKDSLYKETGL